MSGTITKSRITAARDSDIEELLAQFNALVANLDTITAAMDADAGITGTGYAAMVTASKIGNEAGTAVS